MFMPLSASFRLIASPNPLEAPNTTAHLPFTLDIAMTSPFFAGGEAELASVRLRLFLGGVCVRLLFIFLLFQEILRGQIQLLERLVVDLKGQVQPGSLGGRGLTRELADPE